MKMNPRQKSRKRLEATAVYAMTTATAVVAAAVPPLVAVVARAAAKKKRLTYRDATAVQKGLRWRGSSKRRVRAIIIITIITITAITHRNNQLSLFSASQVSLLLIY